MLASLKNNFISAAQICGHYSAATNENSETPDNQTGDSGSETIESIRASASVYP
jgi:hypothetical protein